MDPGLVYAKTPIGDEAVRQSTRVVQRNLRLVLVQIDGKTTVGELSAKIGNMRLVESALKELETGGFIVLQEHAAAAWESGQQRLSRDEQVSAISQFSAFGPTRDGGVPESSIAPPSQVSQFSSFGKPILPAVQREADDDRRQVRDPVVIPEASSLSNRLMRGLRWGFLVVLAGLLVVVFYPYDLHRQRFESVLSTALGVPVRAGNLSLRWLPAPQWVASDVRVGDAWSAATLAVDSPLKVGVQGLAAVASVKLSELRTTPEGLLDLLGREGRLAAMPALSRVQLESLQLSSSNGVAFGTYRGQLEFSAGRLQNGRAENAERTLLLQLSGAARGLALDIEGRGWKPFNAPLVFDALQAKAVLRHGQLEVSGVDSALLGGIVKGAGMLNWAGGGVMLEGDGQLARLSVQQIAAAFAPKFSGEGELGGRLRFSARAGGWENLWEKAGFSADIEILRGVFTGLDLGEATRRGPNAEVRAGTTRFDRLAAHADIGQTRSQFSNIQLEAGLMSASGQARAEAGGVVEGELLASLRTSVSVLRLPMRVHGNLPELTITTGR